MTYHYLPTFLKIISKLSSHEKKKVQETVERTILFFDQGIQPKGLGLKKLRHSYWEVRVDLSLRILFEYKGSAVTFIIVGNHNDIQRILKR